MNKTEKLKFELDVPVGNADAIYNFLQNSKYLILLGEKGESKVLVL